eukprot:scaffold1068_cov167-Amphora_coffeaeformis.AAC.36
MKPLAILRIIGFSLLSLCCLKHANAEDSNDEDPHYLYNGDGAFPVQDYHGQGEEDTSKPNFLFGTNNGPRMVEFYAYWYGTKKDCIIEGGFAFGLTPC